MHLIQVMVFWVMTPCSDVAGYQHFNGPWCCHLRVKRSEMKMETA